MGKAVLIARIVLGLIFTLFGINYFVPFLPQPEIGGEALAFMTALLASGYLFPFMKAVDVIAGIMLLAGRGVPLALTLLAPIIVNIFLFHIFLDSSGMPMTILIVVLAVFLAYAYRGSFRGVLDFSAQPD